MTKLSGELGGASLGGRFLAVLLALVLLLRLELAGLRLFLECLDASGLPLLLVDRLHQNTLVLELVTLASKVAVGVNTAKHYSNGQNDTQRDAEQRLVHESVHLVWECMGVHQTMAALKKKPRQVYTFRKHLIKPKK